MNKHAKIVKKLYEQNMENEKKGTPKEVYWKSEERVRTRFEILTDISDISGKSVLDFGCGNGLLVKYLRDRGIDCKYTGVDISKKMIQRAKRSYPQEEFFQMDIEKENVEEMDYDYVIISGVFHMVGEGGKNEHREWYQRVLSKAWKVAKKGLAVNFMSEFVDWEDPEMYYCPIDESVSFCVNNMSRWFSIRHDYELYEYTLYVYSDSKIKA